MALNINSLFCADVPLSNYSLTRLWLVDFPNQRLWVNCLLKVSQLGEPSISLWKRQPMQKITQQSYDSGADCRQTAEFADWVTATHQANVYAAADRDVSTDEGSHRLSAVCYHVVGTILLHQGFNDISLSEPRSFLQTYLL